MKEELVDVLDEQGNITKEKLPMSAVHDRQHWHGVTHVWIYNKKGQVLLQKRHPDVKWGANTWDLAAGGHIAAGESPEHAAIREAKEEISLNLSQSDLKLAGITTAINTTPATGRQHKTYEWNFITEQNLDPKTLKLQADETSDLKWFDLDEFEADIKSAEKSKNYAPRQTEIYKLIIDNIRKRIKE